MPRIRATTEPIYQPLLRRRSGAEAASPFWWLRYVPATICFFLLLELIYVSGRVALVPVLASFSLAYILNPIVERLQEWKLSRPAAALVALLIVLAVVVFFAAFIIPNLWYESTAASEKISRYFTPVNAHTQRANLHHFSPFLDTLLGTQIEAFIANPRKVLASSDAWSAGALTGVISMAGAAVDLGLIPFFVFYILVDFPEWRVSLEDSIPPRYRSTFRRVFDEIGRILQSYVLGQLLIAMLMGVLYAIGFAILQVPAWAGIAALAGFLNVIPYVGTVSGLLLASGFSYAHFEDGWHVLGVAAVFAIVQSIEGYYLTPRILGTRLRLHPMAVFLGLLIAGKLFGLLGILLAVPTIAILQVIIKLLRELYKGSYFYHAGDINFLDAPSPIPEVRLAQAADSVLTEQVEEQTGKELLAPRKEDDDPAARRLP